MKLKNRLITVTLASTALIVTAATAVAAHWDVTRGIASALRGTASLAFDVAAGGHVLRFPVIEIALLITTPAEQQAASTPLALPVAAAATDDTTSKTISASSMPLTIHRAASRGSDEFLGLDRVYDINQDTAPVAGVRATGSSLTWAQARPLPAIGTHSPRLDERALPTPSSARIASSDARFTFSTLFSGNISGAIAERAPATAAALLLELSLVNDAPILRDVITPPNTPGVLGGLGATGMIADLSTDLISGLADAQDLDSFGIHQQQTLLPHQMYVDNGGMGAWTGPADELIPPPAMGAPTVAVPEPTAAVVLCGLIGLASRRRRA